MNGRSIRKRMKETDEMYEVPREKKVGKWERVGNMRNRMK